MPIVMFFIFQNGLNTSGLLKFPADDKKHYRIRLGPGEEPKNYMVGVSSVIGISHSGIQWHQGCFYDTQGGTWTFFKLLGCFYGTERSSYAP